MSQPTDRLAAARETFAPHFERLRAESARRDLEREHPFDDLRELAVLGLGAVRLPVELGGHGLSITEFFELLVDLGAAEPNLPQALRQHYARVDFILRSPDSPERSRWLELIAGGTIFGNGTSEAGSSTIGVIGTHLTRADDGTYRLNGAKYYSTGNLYADWIPLAALDENGTPAIVTIPADRQGVLIEDDWPGFGQKLTASGTTTFTDVVVSEHEITRRYDPRTHHGAGYHQLVLVATIAGIAEAALRDLTDWVTARTRVFTHSGTADLPRHDPIVQEAVGRARAAAFSARANVRAAASELQNAWELWADASSTVEAQNDAFIRADNAVSAAQVVVTPIVLEQTSHIFDPLGATAVTTSKALDRHWRNARTVSSHNPWIYKARLLGDNSLNGTLPPIFIAGSDVGELPTTAPAAV